MLVVALVVASADVIALGSSVAAMACCAKTHGACAHLQTPDDCCRHMGRGVAVSVSTAPDARTIHFGLTLAILPAIASIGAESAERFAPDHSTFKRPHDPPHLHPIPLLV